MGRGLDDDTHLFELTEKSNNTYMAMSYWNSNKDAANANAVIPNKQLASKISRTHG